MDHPTAAAKFITNSKQLRWHDATIWGTRMKRDRASHSVPEWETLRELASRIKLHTMSRLDEYLEQFEAQATRLGAQVHWARDAAEHNTIVADILQRHGATRAGVGVTRQVGLAGLAQVEQRRLSRGAAQHAVGRQQQRLYVF